ncbi:hypothetical protein ABZ733_18235 [Streptomyces longwoodensis]|uniref:hypothetical protein n=1 Tax=Streptomyces longwoodensis TaxID=68231 RepID=UPI0033FE4D5D
MAGHRTRTTLAACAALSLAALAGAATAPPGNAAAGGRTVAVARKAQLPVLVDCFDKARVRPADFVLACGDGNSRLVSLHWSQWNARKAVGRGVNVVNDCKPYCAAGAFRSYPVRVRLDRAASWTKHPGVPHYTRLTLVYPGGRPAGYPPVVTYQLWN